jgi:23S rRNA (adenine2503-C2)-methyltransferase
LGWCPSFKMKTLHDYTLSDLQERVVADGIKSLHADDLFRVLHRELAQDLDAHKDLLPPIQRWLDGKSMERLTVSRETLSADGWTRKFLLKLEDGQEVESVLMGYSGRVTACLSSQVGCAMGCVFCATGHMGFRRHLRAGEMVAQAHHIARVVAAMGGERLRNIVMMGMGEPLHNFTELAKALDILTDPHGMSISTSRVSISTVGHVPGIQKLARLEKNYTLSVSLHGASDEERGALIPINKRWPIAELLDACRAYAQVKQRKVFISWTLIDGVNDSDDHARRLGRLLKGMEVHINLIPLNPTDGYDKSAPSDERIHQFHEILKEESGVPVTLRQKRGIDVAAGCGQLAGK